MGRVKRKNAFEYAQYAQIQIHTTHAQSFIRAFALHCYILYCQMILSADIKGPDQIARTSKVQIRLRECCPYMPEDPFSHGTTHIVPFSIRLDREIGGSELLLIYSNQILIRSIGF